MLLLKELADKYGWEYDKYLWEEDIKIVTKKGSMYQKSDHEVILRTDKMGYNRCVPDIHTILVHAIDIGLHVSYHDRVSEGLYNE